MPPPRRAAAKPLVPSKGPIPVTLLSGFLGAGKTTMLEHILKNKQGLKCAVVVNDMAEINIDASLVKGSHLLQTKEKLVELHNGCICCTLREDLLIELRKIALTNKFDVVIIESSGIAEPMQVAETFFMDLKDGRGLLNNIARLDNCVTVVDGSSFFDYLSSVQSVLEKWEGHDTPEEDDRNVSHLLIDQIEFANVIVLNKMDQIGDEVRRLETLKLLKVLNPTAHVICTTRSQVDLQELLFTEHFTETFALKAKGWMADLAPGADKHTPETEEYGISSWIYRSDQPFHPKKLYDFITRFFLLQEVSEPTEEEYAAEAAAAAASPQCGSDEGAAGPTAGGVKRPREEEEEAERKSVLATNAARMRARTETIGHVLRSKGYCWIGSPARLGSYGEWSQAGNLVSLGVGGGWGMFPETVATVRDDTKFIEKAPCQELVFIGQDLKRDVIQSLLDACLLTAEEQAFLSVRMQEAGEDGKTLLMFDDPFEPWSLDNAADDADWEDVAEGDDDEGEEDDK
jgi:G3E family GTPase